MSILDVLTFTGLFVIAGPLVIIGFSGSILEKNKEIDKLEKKLADLKQLMGKK